ncbi:HD-like signal output (HDOD) protein [Permianibacter aggregans]|uniref:HD-like signal output (HDOD) protein n=2 Tax=Permianibacter aggregans TaxID=1510150 RepID=A0A4V3D8D3_9GAMM|nr:HD-like signal output (HDOD) protein [Permianibacter aggregans]
MSARLKQWLKDASAEFASIACPEHSDPASIASHLNIPPSALARVVPLRDNNGRIAAIIPADHMLDFNAIKQHCLRDLDVMSASDADKYFSGCVPSCRPAFAMAYGWPCIADVQLLDNDDIYIEAGNGREILRFSKAEFGRLLGDALQSTISVSPQTLTGVATPSQDNEVISHFLPMRFKNRVQETFDLPPMPEIAQEIMMLRADPNASARDLATVVSKDPSLAAQIMSWANSPYYGYAGRIPSLEMAIMRVLGFEMVLNLSLGIAVGRSLNVPREGPLGLKAFWTQAVLCAVLAERLCQRMPSKIRPQRGMVYLSGLLHNFGHLLLGHVFPPQFYLVNRYVEANPSIAVDVIEKYVLGVSHEEIGAWLMQAWQMPEELVTAVRWHHQEEFTSPFAIYSNIVLIANRLLKRIGVGDEGNGALPAAVLASLKIEAADAEAELQMLQENQHDLTMISQKLVA